MAVKIVTVGLSENEYHLVTLMWFLVSLMIIT